jgi:hypothetical protein
MKISSFRNVNSGSVLESYCLLFKRIQLTAQCMWWVNGHKKGGGEAVGIPQRKPLPKVNVMEEPTASFFKDVASCSSANKHKF